MLQDLPAFCFDNQELWLSRVPLIYFAVVEWHQPDRVMRQFGMNQPITDSPQLTEHLQSVNLMGRPDADWRLIHRQYIGLWELRAERVIPGQVLTEPLPFHSEYLRWFRKITLRWISPSSAGVGSVVTFIINVYFLFFCSILNTSVKFVHLVFCRLRLLSNYISCVLI
jgi:hypothetical protein